MTKRIQNAVAKAKRAKCRVRRVAARTYESRTPQGRTYTVRCEVRDGRRYVICNCAAGSVNQVCYHAIGVALLDTAITGYQRSH